jgi:hypothetical protein
MELGICACGLSILRWTDTWHHEDAVLANAIGGTRGCRAVLFNIDDDDKKAWLQCTDQGKARPRTEKTRAHKGCTHPPVESLTSWEYRG